MNVLISLCLLAGPAEGQYRVNGARTDGIAYFCLPGGSYRVEPVVPGDYDWKATGGLVTEGSDGVNWKLPDKPGAYHIGAEGLGEVVTVVVMVPYDSLKKGRLEGYYFIGEYPDPTGDKAGAMIRNHAAQYGHPEGFIVITKELDTLTVSPNFTLGEFACHKPTTFPKLIALTRAHLYTLERICEALARNGLDPTKLRVLSGFRSPDYNTSIGRGKWSRHIFGDAADLFYDADNNWTMDDLDGNGKIDVRDVLLLEKVVKEARAKRGVGLGVGLYYWHKKGSRAPFIHVDTRGFDANWNRTTFNALVSSAQAERALLPPDRAIPSAGNVVSVSEGKVVKEVAAGNPEVSLVREGGVIYLLSNGKRVTLGSQAATDAVLSPDGSVVVTWPKLNPSGKTVWKLVARDATGRVLYSFDRMLWAGAGPKSGVSDGEFSIDGERFAIYHGNELYYFSSRGGLLWSVGFQEKADPSTASVALVGKTVCLVRDGTLYSFGADSRLLYAKRGKASFVDLAPAGDSGVAVLTGSNELLFVKAETGRSVGLLSLGQRYAGFRVEEFGFVGEERLSLEVTAPSGGRYSLIVTPPPGE